MRTNWKPRFAFVAALILGSVAVGFSGQLKGGDPVPKFSVTSMAGKQMFFPDLATGGPLFLYFIRDGDPVSQQATSYINKIIRSYGKSRATWYGIVNVGADRARSYQAETDPAFRLEQDTDMSAMHAFQIANAPTVIEVGGDGVILNSWHGYSAVNMKSINHAMAEASHKQTTALDFTHAPGVAKFGLDFRSGNGGGL